MKNRILFILMTALCFFSSCEKYLDVIPDNVATLDNAFTLRVTAERYLYTCYSYMPDHGSFNSNPGFYAGNEYWHYFPLGQFVQGGALNIAMGNQNVVNPEYNYWDGLTWGLPLFRGIRECNIFLENVGRVPDILESERLQWIAEVKVLKAYYHYWLLRMYGPIPIVRENIPVNAPTAQVRVFRDPVDDVFAYIVELIDEANNDLPSETMNPALYMGKINRNIALAIKAEILITAASPLFNGNPDYANFVDSRGIRLFNTTFDNNKWNLAANACEEAIRHAEEFGARLYDYRDEAIQVRINDSLRYALNIRNAFTRNWNQEVIWANTIRGNGTSTFVQSGSQPRIDPAQAANFYGVNSNLSPTLEVASLFYSDKGVPMEEDRTYDYDGRFNLRTAEFSDRFYIRQGQRTSVFNFNREPRYYASLAFDRGIWYGNGRLTGDNYFYVLGQSEELSARTAASHYSVTGFWAKKLVPVANVIPPAGYTATPYSWPVIRLAALYLAHAEALNEAAGPSATALARLDAVRARSGLQGVVNSWLQYSTSPNKPSTQAGLREIIQRERMIELALEGQNFWDVLRWKQGTSYYSGRISGFNIESTTVAGYYTPLVRNTRIFTVRDYLWPIRDQSVIQNSNLVQNPGW